MLLRLEEEISRYVPFFKIKKKIELQNTTKVLF